MKLLIVDDITEMRVMIKTFLRMSFPDIETDEANSGAATLKKLQTGKYDLVLCDWDLPDMKGDEILKWTRDQTALKDMPFIMITAHNEKDYIVNAIKLGVTDYIVKPLSADTLSAKVNKALGNK